VEDHVWDWGVDITNMIIKDITMSAELQDILASAAKERRLAESKIISAKSDVQSAKLQREAADILSSKSAMQIRYLDVIKMLG
jgi:regulator of protease activity HflC (stomatin/prohibitin superfamily)